MAKRTTATKKTTTRRTAKPAARRAAKPAAAAAAAAEADKTVDATAVAPEAPADAEQVSPALERALGKRELIDRVVTASGIKKSAAKPVVEAMLLELGDALSKSETLNLQPFGKAIVKNRKELENAEVIELRLRRSKQAVRAAATPPSDPLAEAAE